LHGELFNKRMNFKVDIENENSSTIIVALYGVKVYSREVR